ncbi:hypothetical protein EBR43_05815 [bacterium]|nr:hypothetical protein [bacterium]
MKNLLSRQEAMVLLDEFYHLYKHRPIHDNEGGMKSPHMFFLWCLLKKLQPEAIIESGVYKGQGTWLIEQACPGAKLLCIDPGPWKRVYTSPKAVYTEHDFFALDLSNLQGRDVLVFFDDHQDALQRIRKCNALGFKKIVIEDNYPVDQGDCYSPKKALSQQDYCIKIGWDKEPTCMVKKNEADHAFLTKHLQYYQEAMPIFDDATTMWGTPWNSAMYNTPEPLLTENFRDKYPEFYKERRSYCWLCYLQMQ